MLDARRLRLFLGQQGVGQVTWTIVLLGGLITIGFAAFFWMENTRAQMILTSLMAAVFGLMLTLLVTMDHPLWGSTAVEPGPFSELRVNWTHPVAAAPSCCRSARRIAAGVVDVGRPVDAPVRARPHRHTSSRACAQVSRRRAEARCRGARIRIIRSRSTSGSMKKTWFSVFAVLALAACDRFSDPVVCAGVIAPAVQVTVQDSVTGANVTPGATLVLRNATVVDSVTAPTDQPGLTAMGVGGNRTGTFILTVRRTGYQTWTKADVKVKDGPCGAQTVNLTALLQPAA